MGRVVRSRRVNGLSLALTTTDLDFGEGIDGLIAMSGLQRLQERHGMRVDLSLKSLVFESPNFVLMDCRRGKRAATTMMLRRLTMWTPEGWVRNIACQKLSKRDGESAVGFLEANAELLGCRSVDEDDGRGAEAKERERS